MAKAGTAYVDIRGDFSTLNKQLVAALGPGRLGKLGKVGGAAIVGAVAAAGIGKLAYDVGAQFDDAFDAIRAGTGKSGKALRGLEDDFRGVLKTTPTAFAPAADAVASLSSRLGLSGKPLRRLSSQLLELSRITGTDLDANIRESARTFGDWGIAVKNQSGALDQLFRASQATGTPVDRLGQMMVKYGAPLRQLGFDFTTAAATLGKFEAEGVNSELVMGSLRIALGKMAREGIKDPVRELGGLTREIKNAGDAGTANKLALEAFGARAGPDMAAAIREGRFDLGELFKTVGAGKQTIQRTARETEDFAEKWQRLKNRALVALEPAFKAVFSAVGDGADALTKLIDQAGRAEGPLAAFGRSAKEAFETVAPAIATVAKAAGRIVRVVGPGLLAGMGQALRGIAKIIAGSVESIRGAIDIIAGALTLDLGRVWRGIKRQFHGMWTAIQGAMLQATAPMRAAAVAMWGAIGRPARAVFGSVLRFARGALDKILGLATSMMWPLQKVLEGLGHVPLFGSKFKGGAEAIRGARAELDRFRGSLRETNKSADRVDGIRRQIDALREQRRELKRSGGSAKELGQANKRLRQKQAELNDELRRAKPAGMQGAKGIRAVRDSAGNMSVGTAIAMAAVRTNLLEGLEALGQNKPLKWAVPKAAKFAFATGGYVWGDPRAEVPAMLHGNEAVANIHQQPILNRALAFARAGGVVPYGSLPELFRGVTRPNYLASGGFATGAGNSLPQAAMAPIPGMPGEYIHPSILRDVVGLIRQYRLAITDGWAPVGTHAPNSDHHAGLAIDAIPGVGGSWGRVTSLAQWAEPSQNAPRRPFRWVGYSGDAGHGPGHHLHLSWLPGEVFGALVGEIKRVVLRGPDGGLKNLGQRAIDKVRAATSNYLDAALGSGGLSAEIEAGTPLKEMARQIMIQAGFGADQFAPLAQIIQHESGWNPRSRNPSSGAYGLPQALPGNKMASAGPDWQTNPATQLEWMMGYIRQRYGNPANAWKFWQGHNWYARGGMAGAAATGGKRPKDKRSGHGRTGPGRWPKVKPSKQEKRWLGWFKLARQYGLLPDEAGKLAIIQQVDRERQRYDEMGAQYADTERQANLSDEVYVRTGADGAEFVSAPDIARRLGEISGLKAAQEQIIGQVEVERGWVEAARAISEQIKERAAQAIAKLGEQIAKRHEAIAKEKERIARWQRDIGHAQERIGAIRKGTGTAKDKERRIHAIHRDTIGPRRRWIEQARERVEAHGGIVERLEDKRDKSEGVRGTFIEAHKSFDDSLTLLSSSDSIKGRIAEARYTIAELDNEVARIFGEREEFARRPAVPGADTDSARADLLAEQLASTKKELAIAQAQMPVFARFFPPYGGSFGGGGTVPGPIGAPRTIIAHGGEEVGPPRTEQPVYVTVVVEDGAVNSERIRVEMTRTLDEAVRRARSGGPAPGRKLAFSTPR